MVVRRGLYKEGEVEEALVRVREGETFAHVARTSSIPLRTLFKKAKDFKRTGSLSGERRGPKPAIPPELEEDLVEWVAAMQRIGLPVGPSRILERANKVFFATQPVATRMTSPVKSLTKGWYTRFIGRHPVLASRVAQQISRVRNDVDQASVYRLLYTMAALVIKLKLSDARIFNMDETAFMPKGSSRKVVALKGSSNVWSKEAKPNFHMTVVAAVNAAGAAIPPLIILPGLRIQKDELLAITIKNACVSGAPKGFSNARLFRLWVDFFDEQLTKLEVQRPVVLVLDNSSTHVELEAVSAAFELGILLVALPPNATHMYQPLDVAVFNPFKGIVKEALQSKLHLSAETLLSKKDAISIACSAYRTAIMQRPEKALSGFRGTGLFPPSLVNMERRLGIYSNGGAKGELGKAQWLKRKHESTSEVRDDILTLPPAASEKGKKTRVTVDFGGRLVTKEMLLKGNI